MEELEPTGAISKCKISDFHRPRSSYAQKIVAFYV